MLTQNNNFFIKSIKLQVAKNENLIKILFNSNIEIFVNFLRDYLKDKSLRMLFDLKDVDYILIINDK